MSSPFALLSQRRFWPLFWTQFSVAFNDNVFKTGLVLMVTYGDRLFGEPITLFDMGAQELNPVSNLLLILPFVLFSAIAGQVSDKYSKTKVIRWVKAAEIGVMALAAIGFVIAGLGQPTTGAMLLFALIFFMGLQSAFFGPSKYSILPQLLPRQADLVAGNAWVEMGTYFSILGGIALATLLMELPHGPMWFAGAVIVTAILGWAVTRFLPDVPAENPELRVAKEPFTSSWQAARILFRDGDVARSVFGISWFWALGGAILVLFATYAYRVLYAEPIAYAILMGLFAVGIGAGSLVTERLSFGKMEIGLVPIGSFGLTLGLAGLALIGHPFAPPASGELYTLLELLSMPAWWLICGTVLVLSASGGFFMVPLYTLVQSRADPQERSRVIGANNIVNSFFILLVQGGLFGLAMLSVSEPITFGILAAINAVIAIYIYTQVPEFTLRFVAWVLSNLIHRLKVEGPENLPSEGAALLVCNHVSFVDFLIIMGACKRPLRFVMDREMSEIPVLSLLFHQAKIIPITSYKKNPQLVEQAMDRVSEALREGWMVMIFPEGGLTWDGEMMEFRSGVERILERDPVPVVPMALNGLWGSFFSRAGGPAMRKPFRRGIYNRIWLTVRPPIPPEGLTASALRDIVRGIWMERPQDP
ncbi:MAG: MFS transporter [Deltaproteobacteria bacterium]|nr:MAG: MFS transporter [Deltaproteobacteria bacterium]